MNDTLKSWLTQEIRKRGWSYRELARQAGFSHTLISRTLSGDMPPSADFCIKVAQALQEPPEKALRLAGILPIPPDKDSVVIEIEDIAKKLSPRRRQEGLRYLRYLYQTDQTEQ